MSNRGAIDDLKFLLNVGGRTARRGAGPVEQSFGRSKADRGLDQFDTPEIALGPVFVHESLLHLVTSVTEPFCGLGNLVIPMRARGITVHASDIQARGCPDSVVLDFFEMTRRPPDCDILLSNPPYRDAMKIIEHAWALGFRVLVLLVPIQFLNSMERYERLHKTGHLRRVHVPPSGFKTARRRLHRGWQQKGRTEPDARVVRAGSRLSGEARSTRYRSIDRLSGCRGCRRADSASLAASPIRRSDRARSSVRTYAASAPIARGP